MRIALGLTGVLALGLGLAMWLGAPPTLVRPHMVLGLLFVIVLLVRGWRSPAIVGLGLAIILVGLLQQRWLPGEYHWVVRTLHLVLGVSAMALVRRAR